MMLDLKLYLEFCYGHSVCISFKKQETVLDLNLLYLMSNMF